MLGVITEQSFAMLIADCESERAVLIERQIDLASEQAATEQRIGNVADWMEQIQRHSDIQDIDRELLTELIDRIEVGALETVRGEKRQDIKVYYKLVGLVSEQ